MVIVFLVVVDFTVVLCVLVPTVVERVVFLLNAVVVDPIDPIDDIIEDVVGGIVDCGLVEVPILEATS